MWQDKQAMDVEPGVEVITHSYAGLLLLQHYKQVLEQLQQLVDA
jgi:hypothetical protein